MMLAVVDGDAQVVDRVTGDITVASTSRTPFSTAGIRLKGITPP